MELEFDKEIDALLRKANRDSPAGVGAPAAVHLDADELTAFAENALPDQTRQFYVAHLADCDACRKTLSGFIAINPEAAANAASVSTQVATATKLPWYKSLFAMPNLAYTMAALVVMFSGTIGLLVYQNRMAERPMLSEKARSMEQDREHEESEDRPETFSNASSANSTANTASNSPIESVTQSGVAVGSSDTSSAPSSAPNSNAAAAPRPLINQETKPTDNLAGAGASKDEPTEPPKQPAVAAPAIAAKEKDAEDRRQLDEKKNIAKAEQNETARSDTAGKMDAPDQNSASKDMSPGSNSARMKAAGPRQVQSQNQNQMQVQGLPINGRSTADLLVSNLKTAGGKKFELRDGIWYDTAYSGGSKKDVKRGTDKFLKLDARLRSIADQIGGTVVVVWNGKAYKIK